MWGFLPGPGDTTQSARATQQSPTSCGSGSTCQRPSPSPAVEQLGPRAPSGFCLAGVSYPAPKCSKHKTKQELETSFKHQTHRGPQGAEEKTRFPEQTTLEGLGLSRTLSFGCTGRAPNACFCSHLQDSDPQSLDWDLPVLKQHRGHTLRNSGPRTLSMPTGMEEDDQRVCAHHQAAAWRWGAARSCW